jgi:two-component system sensor histidine kinase/response regulator
LGAGLLKPEEAVLPFNKKSFHIREGLSASRHFLRSFRDRQTRLLTAAFRRASIQQKQTLIIMVISGLALLLACAAFVTYDRITFRRAMVSNLSTLADVMGKNCVAALDFDDTKAAGETLNALKAEPQIRAASLYKKQGARFASYSRTGPTNQLPLTAPNENHQFAKDYLMVAQAIRWNGELKGTIYLESDLRALNSRVRSYGGIVALVLAASLFLAFLLSRRLQRLISEPILHLVQTAKTVADKNDYSARATKQSDDELGLLIDRFNEMLTQIQFRDSELQKARDELEKRVEARTADLSKANANLIQQVDERRRAEDALRKSEERFQLVACATNDTVWDWDIAANQRWWNESFETMFGWRRTEIEPGLESWTSRVHPDDLSRVHSSIKAALRSSKTYWSGEYRFRRSNGEYAYIFDRGHIIRNAEGKAIRAVGAMVDITERKRSEHELQQAKEAAEAASRAKSQFLANMSHEIRTPMNGILGMTGLALDTNLTAEQRSLLTTVKESADTLLSIINDILDFSKIEAGKMELEPVAFNLRERMEDTVAGLGLRAHEKGLELACFIDGRVPEHLMGDPLRLRQVVVNLVSNAIKFTYSGEVVLRITCEERTDENVRLNFSVSDTGVGIAEDKQSLIFEAFTQADNSMSRTFGGTGLGLTISKQLIELMGGKIWVESKEGLGSTFHFTAQFVLNPAVQQPTRSRGSNLKGVPVLIVDDNGTNRFILSSYVKRWGMEPTCASNGREALELLETAARARKLFPLMLLDAMMPQIDGFQLAAQIKANRSLKKTIIVMLSSAGQVDAPERCRQAGISLYLTKPVKQSELLDAIMSALGDDSRWSRRAEITQFASEFKPSRPLRILLAEDHPVNQRLATRILEKWGHEIVVAANGIRAIEEFQRTTFDLILMDVQMPDMGGLEATQRIREFEKSRGTHIPIVAMTAHAIKGDREQCLEAGMDDYVSKPIDPKALFEAIEAISAKQAAASSSRSQKSASTLDRQGLLNRVNGDHELLREIATLFAEDTPVMLAQIKQAIRSRNAAEIERSGHRLKGALKNLGAKTAADLAFELECQGRERQLDGVDKIFGKLEQEIPRLHAELEALLSKRRA